MKRFICICLTFIALLVFCVGVVLPAQAATQYQLFWPVPTSAASIGSCISPFGPRSAPTAGASTNHRGIDIAVKSGTTVYAAYDGVVTLVGKSNARGNYVLLYHESIGLSTLYQHLTCATVQKGDYVGGGTQIAVSGATGIGTGAHLHFGVMVGKATKADNDQVSYNMAINPLGSNISYSAASGQPIISSDNPDDYTYPSRDLYYTSPVMTGNDVRWVQAVLVRLGYTLAIDGLYGPITRDTIKQFQQDKGLSVDGSCGSITRAKLLECWNNKKNGNFTIGLETWFSNNAFGEVPSEFVTGDRLYLCYKLIDDDTKSGIDSEMNKTYSVSVELFNPDGESVFSSTFNDDCHGISAICWKSGIYKGTVKVTGDINMTGNVSCQVVYDCSLSVDKNSVSINFGGTNSASIKVTPEGGFPGSRGISWSGDNGIVSASSGGWSSDSSYFTLNLTGLKTGSTDLTVNLYENYTSSKTVVASTTVHVTVTGGTCTITYNANGGTGAPPAQTYTYATSGTTTLSSVIPTRTRYTFLGWSQSSTATSPSYYAGQSWNLSNNGNYTLYAVWRGNPCSITYNANGGTGAPAKQTYYYATSGSTTLSSTVPTRSGYTFLGWSLSSTATTASYTAGQSWYCTNYGDYTLYAVWSKDTSRVVIRPDGGTWNGSTSGIDTQYAVGSVINLGTPTKTGYDFICWTIDHNGSGHILEPWGTPLHLDPSFGNSLSDIFVYNLVSDENATNEKVGHVSLEKVAKTNDCPTSSAYMLKFTTSGNASPGLGGFCQYTASKASGVFYHMIIAKIPVGYRIDRAANSLGTGSSITWLTSQEGTGRFEVYIYKTSCGATGSFGSFGHVYLTGETATASSPVTWYVGYSEVFDGTGVSSSGTNYTVGTGTGILRAIWKAKEYAVHYNANGGSGAPEDQTKYYGTDLTLSSTKPTKSYTLTYNANGGSVSPASKTLACTFKYWNTRTDATGSTFYPGGTYTSNSNETLYAIWENPTVGTLATPTRSGYTFAGWYASASGGTQVTTSTTITGNTTIYAHWTQNDTTKPTGSISTTNNVSSSQTVTLNLSDNIGISGYYWGTSSTYTNNTYSSTSNSSSLSVQKTVSTSGTYYLIVKDTSGNVSNRYSITFYQIDLDARGGIVSPTSLLIKSGNSIDLPVPIREGSSFIGWNTSYVATTGVTSITATANVKYYAIWQALPAVKLSITSTTATQGGTVQIPISIENAADVYDGNFTIQYDSSKLHLEDVEYGSIFDGHTVNCNKDYQGTGDQVRFTFSGAYPLKQDGVLCTLSFSVVGSGSGTADLKFTASKAYNFSGASLPVTTTNGTVTIEEVHTVTVFFDADGGTVSPSSKTVTFGQPYGALPTPTKTNYSFDGWFDSNLGGNQITSSTIVTETTDHTIYALWTHVCAGGHQISYEVLSEPTTTAKGMLYGICSRCGSTQTVDLPKLNTSDYTYSEVQAANCTTTGTGRYTWKNTTYGTFAFDVTIPKTEHVYEINVTAPTCTAQGYTTHTCTVCGSSFKDSFVNALGHAFGAWVQSVAPSCTEKGSETRICSRCGKNETRQIDALGHDLNHHLAQAPSCTEIGWDSYDTCSRCDYSTYVEKAALGHDYLASVTAPTCNEQGFTTHSCSRCGDSYTDSFTDALGHDYQRMVTAPTCTKQGYTTHTCSRCGDSYVDAYVDALGHDFGAWMQMAPPTCTQNGEEKHTCSRCDAFETREIAALGHNYTTTVTEPTCTEAGYTTYTCSRCGDSYVSDEVAALGHTPSASVEENRVNPTCITNGGFDTVTYCSVCGAELTRIHTDLAALGHVWDDGVVDLRATCTSDGVKIFTCQRCGETKTEAIAATGHTPGESAKENELAATCTTAGGYDMVIRCTVCSAILYTEHFEITALGHDYQAVVTEPTCTEGGYTTHTCTRCGDSYVEEETPALGHSPGEPIMENTLEPTCEGAGGYDMAVYCAACGAEISREHTDIAALGHDWNEPEYVWTSEYRTVTATRICKNDASHIEVEKVNTTSEVTKEATYETEGEITYTAAFENAAFETQTKTVATPKLDKPDNPTPGLPCDGGDSCPGNVFTDMPAKGNWAHDAIDWAIVTGITSGTSATTFSPNQGCTRSQVVTFLWRAAGSPEPETTNNPFKDVAAGAWYYKAVLWASETGVTAGTSATTFSPNQTCTRGQIVTFIWRYEGSPEATTTNNPFTDVPNGTWYTKAVLWASETGVTAGTSATTFSPNATCTRAQIVTFLYRDLVN